MINADRKILVLCILLVGSIILSVSLLFIKYLPAEVVKLVGFSIGCAIIFTAFGFIYGLSKVSGAGGSLLQIFRHLFESFKSTKSKHKM